MKHKNYQINYKDNFPGYKDMVIMIERGLWVKKSPHQDPFSHPIATPES